MVSVNSNVSVQSSNVSTDAVSSSKAAKSVSGLDTAKKNFADEVKKASSKDNTNNSSKAADLKDISNDKVNNAVNEDKNKNEKTGSKKAVTKNTSDSVKEVKEELSEEGEEKSVSNESVLSLIELIRTLIQSKADSIIPQETSSSVHENAVSAILPQQLVQTVEQTEAHDEVNTSGNALTQLMELIQSKDGSGELMSQLKISAEDVEQNPEKVLNILQDALSSQEISKTSDKVVSMADQLRNTLVEILNSKVSEVKTDVTPQNMENNNSQSSNTESQYQNLSKNTSEIVSKDDSILTQIAGNDVKEDTKITRASDFMSILQNSFDNVEKVSLDEPIAMTKSDFNNDIIKALSYMDQDGVKDLTVKIYPRELGEVTISVVMEQGTLKAMVKANTKEAVNLLTAGLSDINDKVNGQNLKIQSVEIELYDRDTTYFSGKQGGFQDENGRYQYESDRKNGQVMVEDSSNDEEDDSYNGAINILI